MRLSAIFGITLALALLVASLGYWGYQFSGLSGSPSNDGGNLLRKVNEEVRVQFVFLHVKEKTLDLLYLVSYDPISGRLSAIHLPTQGKVMSPAYGEILSFRELFKRFSNDEFRRELETVLNIDISFWLKSVEGDLRHLVDSVGGLTIEFPVRAASDSASSKTNARWLDGPQVKNFVHRADGFATRRSFWDYEIASTRGEPCSGIRGPSRRPGSCSRVTCRVRTGKRYFISLPVSTQKRSNFPVPSVWFKQINGPAQLIPSHSKTCYRSPLSE